MAALYAVICGLLLCTQVLAAPCPYDGCYCTQENIDCTNLGLTSLPPLKPGNFTQLELDISGNQITAIGDGQLPAGLQDIYSRGNPITTISDHAFVDSARSLTNLVLNNGKFVDLPKALEDLDALTYLEIAHSELQNIKASKEILPNLFYLNMYDNKITSLNGIEIFKNSLLSRIDLHSNGITSMEPLSRLNTVRTISLASNQICDHNHIPGAIAPHIGELGILNLRDNCFTKIPDFSNITSITQLWLGSNKISDCNAGKLPKVIYGRLNLAENKLDCIPSCVADVQNVSNLMLNGNYINESAVNSFTFPSNIDKLDLHDNLIEKITRLHFKDGRSEVNNLALHMNAIKTISDDAFAELPKVTVLDIGGTKIQRAPLALKDLPVLEKLLIGSTPTKCDCSLQDLSTWYKSVAGGLTTTGGCGDRPLSDFMAKLDTTCNNVVG